MLCYALCARSSRRAGLGLGIAPRCGVPVEGDLMGLGDQEIYSELILSKGSRLPSTTINYGHWRLGDP